MGLLQVELLRLQQELQPQRQGADTPSGWAPQQVEQEQVEVEVVPEARRRNGLQVHQRVQEPTPHSDREGRALQK